MKMLLLAPPLPQPKRHRTHVLPLERLPPRGDALRPQRRPLPRRRLHHRRDHQLMVMSHTLVVASGRQRCENRCEQHKRADEFERVYRSVGEPIAEGVTRITRPDADSRGLDVCPLFRAASPCDILLCFFPVLVLANFGVVEGAVPSPPRVSVRPSRFAAR
jgi:hypothetical protein